MIHDDDAARFAASSPGRVTPAMATTGNGRCASSARPRGRRTSSLAGQPAACLQPSPRPAARPLGSYCRATSPAAADGAGAEAVLDAPNASSCSRRIDGHRDPMTPIRRSGSWRHRIANDLSAGRRGRGGIPWVAAWRMRRRPSARPRPDRTGGPDGLGQGSADRTDGDGSDPGSPGRRSPVRGFRARRAGRSAPSGGVRKVRWGAPSRAGPR